MNANDVMKELSKKHRRFPKAALNSALAKRSEVAPLMLEQLNRLNAALEASLDAPTEAEHRVLLKRAVTAPCSLFYGFFLAAEWKQKEAFQPFTQLLAWTQAMLPNLLSEPVVTQDVASRVMAECYDGDPLSLFKLLMDRYVDDSTRFWQWRTLIRVAIRDQIDHDTLRSLLARAFDELDQKQDLMVWSGWESIIIYFGFTELVPLVERAHAAERMFERTMDNFNKEWAYARAHPECPFAGDPIEYYRGLTTEVESAIEYR